MRKILLTIIVFLSVFTPTLVSANDWDFQIENNMEIKYDTDNDYVSVKIEYVREVLNGEYYFPKSGNKVFFIPDLLTQEQENIDSEREFKLDSLEVKNVSNQEIDFSIEQQEDGINVVVPNYKQTTSSSPYQIFVNYNSHDYIKAVNDHVIIQAPSLPEDVELEIVDENTETRTNLIYNLDLLVQNDTSELAKIWPTDYKYEKIDGYNKYSFSTEARIGRNPYLEFGTKQIYKFELEYITPDTSTFIPDKYSNLFNSFSKNIFELSLPRYFDETKQRVKIEEISPTPTNMGQDGEGNIIATFEVDANTRSSITVSGYIWVEQDPFESMRTFPNISLQEYNQQVTTNPSFAKYLSNTKYWQVNDSYIQNEALEISKDETQLLDLIKSDYRYINDKLEYDQSKVDSLNDRIGAKQALQGESAVCMEYADAMISILRAQGIAARAAIGYANLKEYQDMPESQVRHQWVQVWVPNYGWLSIDPTWESENMDIGPSINRILWETFNGNDLSNTKIYSADSLDNIDDIEFNISIYAVTEDDIPSEEENTLKTYEEILPLNEITEEGDLGDWFNKFIKASTIGRSIAILIPVFSLIVLSIIFVALIKALVKKTKRKSKETL